MYKDVKNAGLAAHRNTKLFETISVLGFFFFDKCFYAMGILILI